MASQEDRLPDGSHSAPSRSSPMNSAVTEASVRRKIDWNIMPLFFALYMLAFLDRSNIGNAELAGMGADLHLKSDQYDWLLTIFYITYIIFEFAVLLWKVYPPHIVGGLVVFGWGIMATLQAAAQNWSGLMALRFLLGAFEAAYGPGIIYLLSFFYLRSEIGFRCGLFASAAPIATTFAGALAYGIVHGHSRLRNWRLLFLVEGLPTVLMAPVAWYFIPDSPDKARFLNEEEREIVRARAVRQAGTKERLGSLDPAEFLATLLDPEAWIQAIMYFSTNVSYASLPVFLPNILNEMGYNTLDSQGLTAPPFFLAFLTALLTTFIADRTHQRGFTLIFTSALGGIGYLILATVDKTGVRYFAVFLAASGVFSTIPNILAWVLNNQGSDTGRGASIVLINLVGQCGPVLGTRLYPKHQGPRYVKGMSICASFMFFTTLMAILLRGLFVWENRKLNRKLPEDTKPSVPKDNDVAVENHGPNFRYVL